MSMKPAPLPEPDPQVAVAIRAMYHGLRKVPLPLAVAIRDKLGGWLHDEDFASRSGCGAAQGIPRWCWRWSRCCSRRRT